MLAWLSENYVTVIIVAVLVGIVAWVIISMARSRRQGKSACGCDCGSPDCPYHSDRTHRFIEPNKGASSPDEPACPKCAGANGAGFPAGRG